MHLGHHLCLIIPCQTDQSKKNAAHPRGWRRKEKRFLFGTDTANPEANRVRSGRQSLIGMRQCGTGAGRDHNKIAGRTQIKDGRCNPTTSITINAATPSASSSKFASALVAISLMWRSVVMSASPSSSCLFVLTLLTPSKELYENICELMRTNMLTH